jgi:predicted transcriptional regulator
VGLGCALERAHELVYADGVNLDNQDAAVPVGVTCRLCDRTDCEQRAFPPLREPLVIDENVRGVSIYAPTGRDAKPSQLEPPRKRAKRRKR